MSDARNPERFPDDIKQAISRITSVVAGFAGTTFSEDEDGETDIDLTGVSVDQWALRDFARYFSERCAQLNIPYVLKYARDVQAVKQIKSDLASAGRSGNMSLRAYLDWAFDNRQMMMEKEAYFTLGTVQKYVTHFLQSLPDEDEHRPSWGDAIGPLMLEEYKMNRVIGLLVRFGIPLTAIFLRHAGFGDDRILQGISSRLSELAAEAKYEAVARVARQSISSSPYPDTFPMLDWRTKLTEIWDVSGCRAQAWWRETDYGGRPYIEYDEFVLPLM